MNKDLYDLNERFYALYGRLYENSELLTREQRDYTAKNLLEQYKNELELLQLRQSVERGREIYELRQKRSYLIPRTWRFLLIFKRKYNFAAELLNRQVYEEVQNVYTLQELAIEKLHRQLMDEETAGKMESDIPEGEQAAKPQDSAGSAEQGEKAPAESKVEGEQAAEPQDPAESAEQGEEAPAGSKAEGEQAAEPQDSAESEEQGEKVPAESKAEGERAAEQQDLAGDAEQGEEAHAGAVDSV